ncbi:hypothetical protein BELL_1265g00010 [Botrytis elliptica]|uniref:Uncharacterized protein n=1 Tax=Botrytis elliptica TaxID=278938 RepID=A0A4Z1IQJ8_9HELO|nr:hypothetical protein EAE99_008706 [Botrytis elliptica]TGO59023.1 hypothetical protein BELL_1265g00010 [Botrytis elliptica]
MSIRSAAGSRAGGRPVSVYRAVAPSSHSSGPYYSSRSGSGSIYTEPYDYGSYSYDSYSSRSSDGGSEVLEGHRSTGPRTSTHHQLHNDSDAGRSHIQDLEKGVAATRQEWNDGVIDPPETLLRTAICRRGLDMIASSDACKEPSLKLRVDGVDEKLKQLEVEANVRRAREGEEMQDMARDAERRENERRGEFERQQHLMREKAAEKERIRDEKEAKNKKKAEERKQKRIEQQQKKKVIQDKFTAAMKETKRLKKLENEKNEEQRIQEKKKANEKKSSRDKAARDRDIQREAIDKQEREAEEEARYQKEFQEEEMRYNAKKALEKKAKVALGGREEESRKRVTSRAVAFAKKVMDDREDKLNRELDRVEEKIKQLKGQSR